MNYSLGQIADIRNIPVGDATYCKPVTPQEINTTTVETKFFNIPFKDAAIDYKFYKGSYFLSCKVNAHKKLPAENLCSIIIKLKNSKDNKSYQYIKKIDCDGLHDTEMVCCINSLSDFDLLVFEIERKNLEELITDISDIQIYKVTNNIDGTLKRIGLQAKPGSVFIINDEEIRIGKTGMLEFKNDDVPIYSFSCLKAEEGFILDYIKIG